VRCPVKLRYHEHHKFCQWLSEEELPNLVQSCELPVIVCSDRKLIISGLCPALRYIVQTAQQEIEGSVSHDFAKCLKNLLGSRKNCLRACAEVSEWTLYTEVTLPQLVETVINNSFDIVGSDLPAVLLQLENQLAKLPVEPSKHRNRKHDKNNASRGMENVTERECGTGDGTHKLHEAKVGVRSASLVGDACEKFDKLQLVDSTEEICGRRFVEGDNVQLTDLVLFVCIQLLFGSKNIEHWCSLLPRIMAWYQRMAIVPNVSSAVNFAGLFEYYSVAANIVAKGIVTSKSSTLSYARTNSDTTLKSAQDESHFSSASSGCSSDSVHTKATADDQSCIQHTGTEKTKFHVSQGLIDAAVTKATKAGLLLEPLPLGNGRCLQLPWEQYPSWVLPCGLGGVPDKRAARKLQQLENIADAVKELVTARSTSSKSNVIVDFCSGAGHVGILLAHLFPHYNVCYLLIVYFLFFVDFTNFRVFQKKTAGSSARNKFGTVSHKMKILHQNVQQRLLGLLVNAKLV